MPRCSQMLHTSACAVASEHTYETSTCWDTPRHRCQPGSLHSHSRRSKCGIKQAPLHQPKRFTQESSGTNAGAVVCTQAQHAELCSSHVIKGHKDVWLRPPGSLPVQKQCSHQVVLRQPAEKQCSHQVVLRKLSSSVGVPHTPTPLCKSCSVVLTYPSERRGTQCTCTRSS